MKKKFVILFLSIACALCLAFAFAGCTDENGESSNSGSNTQQGETGGGHVHNYGNLIPEKPATCTKEGLQAHYYCSGCQKYFDSEKQEKTLAELKISVDPNAHNYGNLTPEKPATCTEVGLQAHYYCSGCQKYFNDQKVEKSLSDLTIPALGHILEENQLVCKTCNEQLAESLTFELNSDNTYKLTSGTPTSGGKIMIPKIYNNLPVTSIGNEAFYNCTILTSITIPDSVTSIGYNAFYGCTNLKGVYITDIAAWCNIDFRDYGDNPLYYAHNLYLNNQLITELTAEMLQGVTTIKKYAFQSCTSLQSITIPNSVTSIGKDAFNGCTSLKSITIPDSVTSIGESAFHGCTSLTSITIPDSVASIGRYAFQSCTSLTRITIPDSVTSIGWGAFYGCTSLESITIPDSVESIDYEAFRDCTNLTSVTIGNGVTSIGGGAFKGCKRLKSVIIGNGVTSIGGGAFGGCTNLKGVYITDIAAWCNIDFDNPGADPLGYAHNLYLDSQLVTELTAEMLQGVTTIKYLTFYGCTSLQSVTIPDSVTSIGSQVFVSCRSLESITIGNGVTSIGDHAFNGCTNLTSITVTDNNTEYASQDGILYNKDKTELIKVPETKSNITIPDSVTSIGEDAFSGCTGLTSINIPDSVTSIGESAFHGCTSLTSITIPDSVASIGRYAFYNCTSLESVTIGNGVTSIGDHAFNGCTNLKGVYITDIAAWCNIDFEGYYAYPLYYAHNLYLDNQLVTELTAEMLQGVTTIKDYAFYGCTSLESVTIPDSITTIGESAFYNCTSLESVTFNNPNGWYVTKDSSATSGTDIPSEDLQNTETAATYLRSTYSGYEWKRKTT